VSQIAIPTVSEIAAIGTADAKITAAPARLKVPAALAALSTCSATLLHHPQDFSIGIQSVILASLLSITTKGSFEP
jgi:hypothetical protein